MLWARRSPAATRSTRTIYPNPFKGSTTLRFDLPEPARVSLVIYDVLGRVVETGGAAAYRAPVR